MSIISYNGVTLPYGAITDFRHEAVRDESDTDHYLDRYTVTSTCVVNPAYVAALAPDMAALAFEGNAAEIMRVIRSRLMRHRRKLSVTFNGVELMPLPTNDGGTELQGWCDAANGPKPQYCNITRLDNATFLLSYQVVAHYRENAKLVGTDEFTNEAGSPFLYNRWSETTAMDPCNFVTRTRDGVARIRSDNVEGQTAGQLLPLMAPVGVPTGFLRKRSSYTVDPSGLAISYHVEDVEQFKMPPGPAHEADGEYIESTTNNQGTQFGEIRVLLRGQKFADQDRLIRTACEIGVSMLIRNINRPLPGAAPAGLRGPVNVIGASVRFSLYRNEVEFRMRAQFRADRSRIAGLAAFGGMDTTVPLSDGENRQNPNQFELFGGDDALRYPLRGSASRLLQAAAYFDPYLQKMQLDPATGNLTGERVLLRPGQAGKFTEV